MTLSIEQFLTNHLPEWAFNLFAGHQLWQWGALTLAVFVGLLLKLIAEQVVHRLKDRAQKNEDSFFYHFILALERPIGLMVATAFWFACSITLGFEGSVRELLFGITEVLFGTSIIWGIYQTTEVIGFQLSKVAEKTDNSLDERMVPMVVKALKLATLTLGPLIVIQNLGVNVMSLMAGLGLGGLAFALAAKDTAANLFGSIMIIIDRPFRVGDWIVTTQGEGIVEDIGFRSTRIRSFYNSLISVPNSVLVVTQIDNLGKREMRRIRQELSLTYDTPPEKMEAFVEGLKNIILAHPKTDKERFLVAFQNFGAHSLDVLFNCFVRVDEIQEELLAKQNIFLEILRLAQSLEVQFAFPTQSIVVEAFPEKQPLFQPKQYTVDQLKQTSKAFGPGGEASRTEGLGLYQPHFRELMRHQ